MVRVPWCECSIPSQVRRGDSLGGGCAEAGLTGTQLLEVQGEAGLPAMCPKRLLWAGMVPVSGGCCMKWMLL